MNRPYAVPMNQTGKIVAAIEAALPDLKSGSISIFGEVFGGRIDNQHRIVGASVGVDEEVVIHFDGGECLRLWSLGDTVTTADEVRFGTASRVRWEWTYYGRPDTPENRFFMDYVVDGLQLTATTDAPWAWVQTRTLALPDSPAAEIVWF